jgi:hypothetical protein
VVSRELHLGTSRPSLGRLPHDRARASAPLARCSLSRAPQLGNSAPLIPPLPGKPSCRRLFACARRYTHKSRANKEGHRFFFLICRLFEYTCLDFALSAVIDALDALLLRKVPATIVRQIAHFA